jgi:hypothetical protein
MNKRFLLAAITACALLLMSLGLQARGVRAASSARTILHETAIAPGCEDADTGSPRGYVDWVRVGSITANVHLRGALPNQFYHINWLCQKDDIGGLFTDQNGNGDASVTFDPGTATDDFTLQLIAAAGGGVIDEIRDSGADLTP